MTSQRVLLKVVLKLYFPLNKDTLTVTSVFL